MKYYSLLWTSAMGSWSWSGFCVVDIKNNVGHEASSLVDIFRNVVMLCQFYPSYNRKLVGIQDVLGTEEVRLYNSKNQLKVNANKMNPTNKLQFEEFDSDLVVSFSLQAVWTPIKQFFHVNICALKLINHHYIFNLLFLKKSTKIY